MITISDVKDEIVKIAKQYPKAVYCKAGEACLYSEGKVVRGPNREGCIVGQALMNLGVKFSDREADARDFLPGLIDYNPDDEDDRYQMQLINSIQDKQDKGTAWGKCVGLI